MNDITDMVNVVFNIVIVFPSSWLSLLCYIIKNQESLSVQIVCSGIMHITHASKNYNLSPVQIYVALGHFITDSSRL